MSRILVLGALHYDVVVDAPRLPGIDETLPGSAVDYRFGGKGGNQAVAAARMGADVVMAGRVGRDEAARMICAALDAARVDRSLVLETDGPTGMSVAISLPGGDYGAVIVPGAIRENDGDVSWEHAPATVLLQNEIPEAANLTMASRLPAETRLIVNAAPARALPEALAQRIDLLIVNRVEAGHMSGRSDPVAAAVALAPTIKGSVILTQGGEGAILADKDCVSHFPAFPVEAVSAHGAGDMFTGALAAHLTAGATTPDALRFAQAAAALFVASPIAERDRVTREAVAAFLRN